MKRCVSAHALARSSATASAAFTHIARLSWEGPGWNVGAMAWGQSSIDVVGRLAAGLEDTWPPATLPEAAHAIRSSLWEPGEWRHVDARGVIVSLVAPRGAPLPSGHVQWTADGGSFGVDVRIDGEPDWLALASRALGAAPAGITGRLLDEYVAAGRPGHRMWETSVAGRPARAWVEPWDAAPPWD